MANFCSGCCEHLDSGMRYCGSCGHPVPLPADEPTAPVDAAVPAAAPTVVAAPNAAEGGEDRSRWWKIGAAGLGVALLLAIGFILTRSDSAEAEEVFLVAAAEPGPDPFTASVAVAGPSTTTSITSSTTTTPPATSAPGQVPARNGSVPGLYGGTGSASSCDRDQLVAFLAAEPAKAAA